MHLFGGASSFKDTKMSNCIFFHNSNVITIPAQFIDGKAFIKKTRDVYDQYEGQRKDKPLEGIDMIFAYFLTPNNTWLNDNNSVSIAFGDGASGHTNRDFNGAIQCIAKYMNKSCKFTVDIEDEGFPGVFTNSYTFVV